MCLTNLNDRFKALPKTVTGYKLVLRHNVSGVLIPLFASKLLSKPWPGDEIPMHSWRTCHEKAFYGRSTLRAIDYPIGFHWFRLKGDLEPYKTFYAVYSGDYTMVTVKGKFKDHTGSGETCLWGTGLAVSCYISRKQKIEKIVEKHSRRM